MKPIGGYFELESYQDSKNDSGYLLNSGRNCLELILTELKPKMIWMPNYTCRVLREPIESLNLRYETYSIDQNFLPVLPSEIPKDQLILYTNYFGICMEQVEKLKAKYTAQLIIDNAQAYYDSPDNELASFYSPRKFFGVPDGGILHCKLNINILEYELDQSGNRLSHLIKRFENGPEAGYQDFVSNDNNLIGQPIKRMSNLSKNLLSLADTEEKRIRRLSNFTILHEFFGDMNEIKIKSGHPSGPLCYPLLIENGSKTKKHFIENKIYTPTYWPDVFGKDYLNSFEERLRTHLVCLPIDHRYEVREMKYIIKVFKELGKR